MPEIRLIRCPACGATNRVPWDRVEAGVRPACGRCKRPLPISEKPVTVTDPTFASEVERSPMPVLLDLWAPWCGPCLTMAPLIEELATELAGRVKVAKLNVDESPATAARFAVRAIPTLLTIKDGREVDRIVGVQPKSEIVRRLEKAIA
jgi:thioredoxin 2